MTFDHLQLIFWSITYILLILYAIRFRIHGSPLPATLLSLAWETVALANSVLSGVFSWALMGHLAWFSLDLVLVCLYLFHETNISEKRKEKLCFLGGYLVLTAVMIPLFEDGYMLISSFIIDIAVALFYLHYALFKHRNKSMLLFLIGNCRLLGDAFAWLFYRNYPYIEPIGISVLICNILYLIILSVMEPIERSTADPAKK